MPGTVLSSLQTAEYGYKLWHIQLHSLHFFPIFHHLIVHLFYKKQTKILKRTNYVHDSLKRKSESLFCIIRSLFSNEVKWKSHSVVSSSLSSQARILEWVAFAFSRGSSQPRDWTQVSRISGGFFTIWATREAWWSLEKQIQLTNYICFGNVKLLTTWEKITHALLNGA